MEVKRTPNQPNRHNRRGVVGIESAIVLIAFVIVAAALAFVVLNMGFTTTQKAKTTITSGLGEASSAIEVAGQVTGLGNTTKGKVAAYTIPIKTAAGGSSISIDPTRTSIKFFSKSLNYDNIYASVNNILNSTTYASMDAALTAAQTASVISAKPGVGAGPADTEAIVYFTTNLNKNNILDPGEQAIVMIVFDQQSPDERPAALDIVTVEIIPSGGSPLSIQRNVPTITDVVVNLG